MRWSKKFLLVIKIRLLIIVSINRKVLKYEINKFLGNFSSHFMACNSEVEDENVTGNHKPISLLIPHEVGQ